MKKVALLALALVAGCGPASADGYDYGAAEFERGVVTVTVVTHPNLASLREAAVSARADAGEDRELMAFGIVGRAEPTCTIHIVEPAKSYRPEWIGHEFTHCIRGRWHS